MRCTQSSWVSLTASGGSPWIKRYSGERRLRKPVVRSTSRPPILPTCCTRASSASRSRNASAARGSLVTSRQTTKTPADPVRFVDRAVAVGPPDLFEPAVTRHRDQLILMPGSAAAAHHLFDLRTDDGPDFRPAVAAALTQRARVPLRTHGLAVGVIIELNELRPPPDE